MANGHVFAASNQQLTIFGLGGHPFVGRAAALDTHKPPHEITGVLEHIDGPVLTLRTRAGKIARVDDSEALRKKQTGVLVPGYAYTVQGTYDPTGALHAQAVARAKDSARRFWGLVSIADMLPAPRINDVLHRDVCGCLGIPRS